MDIVAIIISVITFILGYFAEKLMDKIQIKVKQMKEMKIVKEFISNQSKNKDIQLIANGSPYYNIANQLFFSCMENDNVFVSFPPELSQQLLPSSGGFAEIDNLPENIYAIENIDSETIKEAIETARREVALRFIKREDGLYFNGKKYGVVYSDGFSRTCDVAENPILTYRLFKTDHFSHRVLNRTLDILHIPSESFSIDFLNHQIPLYRTSLGVSIIVIIQKSNQIIITKRAKTASYSGGKGWFYVSATETFSETDYDEYKRMPSIMLCIKRGLLEELNIDSNMYDENSIYISSAFYEKNFHQDGLVAVVKLNENISYTDIDFKNAKDHMLEIDDINLIDNSKQAIEEFIKDKENELRPQTIFSLRSYISTIN